MTDKREPTNYNVYVEDGKVHLDLFGPGHFSFVRREDADAGIVFDPAMAQHIGGLLHGLGGSIRP